MGLVLIGDGGCDDADGRNVLNKGSALWVGVKGLQDPHAHVEGTYSLVYEKELSLHIEYLGIGQALYPVLGGIVDEIAYLFDGAAGLSHGGNKEKRTDLSGGVVVISILRIHLGNYYSRFIVVS